MLSNAVPFVNPNPMLARGAAVLTLAASLAFLGACAGSTDVRSEVRSDGGGTGGAGGSSGGKLDAGSLPLSCDHFQLVLDDNCTGCHTSLSAPYSGSLDLMSDNIAARLVGKPAATASGTNQAMCTGKGNLLNRGTLPATGILLDKLKTPPVVCGNPMPLGGAMLAQEDIDCLQAWANGLVNSVGP